MSERKTIQFNPAFFSASSKSKNTTLKTKPKKHKPDISPNVRPNNIKRQLLDRIKTKQKENEDKNKLNGTNDNIEDKEFSDEFNKSLGFLQDLANNEENKKRKNKTLKNTSSMISVNTELPSDFDIPLSEVTDISKPLIHIKNKYMDHNTYTPQETKQNNNLSIKPNTYTLKARPPYSNIRGSTRPTYREWKSMTQKPPINKSLIRIEDKPVFRETQRNKNLEQVKRDYQTTNDNYTNIKERKHYKKMKRITRTVKYNLGKSGGKVSVLIKNNNTRKKIQHEHALLRQKSIIEIKNYLRDKNLLKTGSNAPNDVLRQMYEQSILSGDINNLGKNTLIHNFLHK